MSELEERNRWAWIWLCRSVFVYPQAALWVAWSLMLKHLSTKREWKHRSVHASVAPYHWLKPITNLQDHTVNLYLLELFVLNVNVFFILRMLFCFFALTAESLVHLQRDDDGRERDTGCVEPGSAVRRGGCRPRRHGKVNPRHGV